MTIAVLEPDPIKDITDLKAAVSRLERGRGGALYDSNGGQRFPRGITIGETYVFDPVPPPTNLAVTWGSDFDRIFIDASWGPPAENADQVATYLAELTEDGVGVVQSQGGLGGTSYRFQGAKPNTDYTVRVWSYNRLGKPSVALGPVAIRTGADSSQPAAPAGLTLRTGIGVILAYWDENTEEDVELGRGTYEVQLSQSPTLAADGSFATVEDSKRTSALVQDFSGLSPTPVRYVHVRAIDSSGNFGPFSAIASATPNQVQEADLADFAVTRAKIGLLAVDDARINDLRAGKLTSDEINAAILTIAGTGMMRVGRTSSPYNYILKDSTGLRFYTGGTGPFAGGTLTMDLNVQTGNAFFGGSLSAGVSIDSPVIVGGTVTGAILQTGTSGRRVIIDPSTHFMYFYSGDSEEAAPAHIRHVAHGSAGTGRSGSLLVTGPQFSGDVGGSLQLYAHSADGSIVRGAVLRASPTGSLIYVRDDYITYNSGTGAVGHNFYVGPNNVFADLRCEFRTDRINFWNANVALNDKLLTFRGIGDGNQTVGWNSANDAPILTGFESTMMKSTWWDKGLILSSNTTASVNASNSGWVDHTATAFIVGSDAGFKTDIAELARDVAMRRFRATKPKRFKLKAEKDGRERWGFVAQDVPSEARLVSSALFDDHTEEEWAAIDKGEMRPRHKQALAYDSQAMLAILWLAAADLDERIAALESSKGA